MVVLVVEVVDIVVVLVVEVEVQVVHFDRVAQGAEIELGGGIRALGPRKE